MNNDRLKFRLWDIKNEEYVEDQCDECCIYFDGRLHAGAYCDDGYTGHWDEYEQHEVIIEQCTGLRDKNGNLIYDGDIIRWYGTHKTQDYKVVWVNAGWCLKNLRTMATIAMTGLEASEIIGNIHEQKDGE